MRLRAIVLAAPLLLAPAAFNASYAQSTAAAQHTFDWIFFIIIGIPFLLGLVALLKPGLLEPFIRDWPWETRRASWDAPHNLERPDQG